MKIGIDLGGTKTEAILIDNKGTELSRKRIVTQKNYNGTIEVEAESFKIFWHFIGGDKLLTAVLFKPL